MQKLSSWTKYIIIGVLVVALAGTGVYFFSKNSGTVISPGEVVPLTPTPVIELTTWDDPAGFSFQYPKDLTIDSNEEDNDNYAHVELTTKDHLGSVIVWASDLPKGVTTLDSWIKKLYPAAASIDTTLGGEPAKKILIATPSAKFIVGTISEGLLFYIDGTLMDKEYWQGVADGIAKTFTFTPEFSDTSGQAADSAADEEEVVQ